FLDEHEFAGEEEPAVDEPRVMSDKFIGSLLKRQLNIDAEAVSPAGALVAGLHNAGAGAGNGHESVLGDLFGKIQGLFIFGMVLGRARGAEDRDFALLAV